jgi:hypothetical protein
MLLPLVVLSAAAQVPERAEGAPYESDILAARPVHYMFGVGPGMMWYNHGGSFSPSCDCIFDDAEDYRVHFAGELLVRYPKVGIAYGVLVSYYDVSADFTRDETRRSVVIGDDPPVDVAYRSTSNVTLRWLSITPEILWYLPRANTFLQAGLEFGISQRSRYNHIETIQTEGYTYYDGSTENVLLEERPIPGGDGLRLALALGAGHQFDLSPSLSLTPRAGVNLPLTAVSTADDEWRVMTAYGLLMLHFRL